MYATWEKAWSEIERLVAESAEEFPRDTVGNVRDFIAFARGRYAIADDYGLGYRPTVSLCWSKAKPTPIEIEVHEDHYEFYQFFDGRTDIRHFPHLPDEPIPVPLIDILNQCLLA